MKNQGRLRFTYPILMLLMILICLNSFAQQREIQGTVKDENKLAIEAVSVSNKGTTQQVQTDRNGHFKMTVAHGSVLSISYIGYKTQEVKVDNASIYDIILVKDNTALDEVVVIGYGTVKKKDLTGSLASVGAEAMKDKPVANVGEALQGRASGVQVINSGAPGSNVSIQIRGLGSINNSAPLLVIDGVPTDLSLNALNPNDVETIDILKDASATAIYGSRGANGVVLISTKKGNKNKGSITASANYAIQQATSLPKMLNAQQFASLHNEMMANNNNRQRPDFADPTLLGRGTDWLDALLQTGKLANYALSYAGGGEKNTYYVSAGILNQDGIVKNTDYKRYNFQFNNEAKQTAWLKLGNTLTLSHDVKHNGSYSVLNTLASLPTQPIFNEDGTYSGPGNEAIFYGDLRNPIGTAMLEQNTTKGYNLLGNIYAEASFLNHFTFKTLFGLDYKAWDNMTFSPKYNWKPIPVPNSYRSESFNKSLTYLWDNTLTYANTFEGGHEVNVMLGSSAQNNDYNYMNGSIKEFLSDNNNQLNNGLLDPTVGGSRNEWALLSFFGRANYTFKNRYLLTATVRRDGTSRIATANRWGTFPSFSAAWRISEESFFNKNDFWSDVKLRIGYGVTGNQAVLDNYAASARLKTGQYVFNGIPVSTLYPLVMPNPGIRWETIKQQNVGIDASFFKNRIQLTMDAYIKKTSDMLVKMSVPITTGYSDSYTPMINAGEVENKGWELSLRSQNLKGELVWNTDFNISYNRNKVVRLDGDVPIYYGYQSHTIGQSVGSFYGYLTNGIFQNWAEVNSYAYQYQGADPANSTAPGDLKFRDINKDGVVNDYDRTYLGNPTPSWSFAMNNKLSYKNIDLEVFFQGVSGNQIYNANRVTLEGMYTIRNQTTKVLDRWTAEGTSNEVPRAIYSDPNKNTRNSDRFIEQGKYLRLKNLTVGYTLPEAVAKRLHAGRLRFYFSGQNLFTWTKYSGFDPEVIGGVDNSNYPITKNFSLGLDLRF
ncbi:MAG: TonB-dependent receptor [Sphingobacterium sp.]|jgi:TonB-linked SusC/RagA family outer membrane protein|uniref:SusC/RagA family TonB-linked outer membrane protein n=1 Tax=Sphingobacterium sp. TaxID=341027 RepID=UPI0028473909|nr:TonB-dependent receptor [Sphingobacterium sp.]MDR3008168.1 TonB-dependent receptor [Sphingobacterium sp.]